LDHLGARPDKKPALTTMAANAPSTKRSTGIATPHVNRPSTLPR
jgi:hypothetical protein